MNGKVLKSELAGRWYTDHPGRLAREIDLYLDEAELQVEGHVMALLLPHAGYSYSGRVAAHGVRQIVGQPFTRVVVMGPSHRVAMADTVSIPDVSSIETPLGRIEIDREWVTKLWENRHFQSHLQAHAHEHSVQIELPFLQRALGDFKLVPMVCGELSEASARTMADVLLENIDEHTLVVVSSDFTHYGRSFDYVPFHDEIQGNLRSLDMGAFKQIENRNLPGFLHYVRDTGATICGRSPIAILLAMLPGTARATLLKYDTSGNQTGDWTHCVSYISAAFTGRWEVSRGDDRAAGSRLELSESDKAGLLYLARHCIARRLRSGEPDCGLEITPPMKNIMGAFVTLHSHGQLRGCIGEIFPRRELHEAVAEQAVNAAFHDPRFPRVCEDELPEIEIEISALTAPRKVKAYGDIEIGKHGIVLRKGAHSAVFLPQVATEQGWTLEETLSYLAMKAGLAHDDWQSDCEFHVFEAIVFGEQRTRS